MDVAPVMLGGAEYRVLLPEGVDVYVNKVAGGYLVSVSGDARVYGRKRRRRSSRRPRGASGRSPTRARSSRGSS